MIASLDPRICAKGALDLTILIPGEREPVKAAGKIAWHSEGKKDSENKSSYLAGISITRISLNDKSKLERIINRNKVSFNQGFKLPGNARKPTFG